MTGQDTSDQDSFPWSKSNHFILLASAKRSKGCTNALSLESPEAKTLKPLPNLTNLPSKATSHFLLYLVKVPRKKIAYTVKALQGITMLPATEADGRVNWVIDLEPLKA